MTDIAAPDDPDVGTVTVRYWAAARAAAGVELDVVPVAREATLAEVLAVVRARHASQHRLAEILAVCSVLVGDRPMGRMSADEVVVRTGETVEMLPPFAGG